MGRILSFNDYRKVKPKTAVAPISLEGVRTRRAVATDATPIAGFVAALRTEFGVRFDLSGEDSDLRDLTSNYHAAGGTFLLMEGKPGILATAGLRFAGPCVGELTHFHLTPGLRGQGAGKKLFKAIVGEAGSLGYLRLEIELPRGFDGASRFFTAMGFELTSRAPSRAWASSVYSKRLV